MKKTIIPPAVLFFTTVVCSSFAFGVPSNPTNVISIDWYGGYGADGSAQSQMDPTEIAGIIPVNNWNSFSGSSQTTPLSLFDNTGAATGATVTWSADGIWDNNIGDTPGNFRMMLGYLDSYSPGTPITVTISNLPASFTATGYDVYVYSDGLDDNDTRTFKLSIGSLSATVTDNTGVNFSGSFTANANYAHFAGLTSNSLTITATPETWQKLSRAEVNGIQIVAVPEPTTAFLLYGGAAGLFALWKYRRRSQAC